MASGVGAVHLQRILKKLPATIAVINVVEAGTFTAEGSLKFITEPKDRVRVANAIAQVRSLARAVRSEAVRYTGYAGFAGETPASAGHVKEQGADAISVCLAAILTTRDMFLHRWRASPSARNFVTQNAHKIQEIVVLLEAYNSVKLRAQRAIISAQMKTQAKVLKKQAKRGKKESAPGAKEAESETDSN